MQEHACVYSMARDTFRTLRKGLQNMPELPKLKAQDLHIATHILGSAQSGQRNKQPSWIWSLDRPLQMMGLGWMVVSDHTYLIANSYAHILIFDTVERVHWLRAKAQFERWLEEQKSIHNEAHWIPAYFQARSQMWKRLVVTAAKESLKGHEAYASAQEQAWDELSKSSKAALSLITDASLRTYEIESILMS